MKKELKFFPVPDGRELQELREIVSDLERLQQVTLLEAVFYGYAWGVAQGKRMERRRRLSSKIDMLPETKKQIITKLVGWLLPPHDGGKVVRGPWQK
jgi:hypothetical protein